MLELGKTRVAIVRCFAEPRALDAFPPLASAKGRVAPDELWFLGPAMAGADLTRRASSYLEGADPGGLAIDQSEGWSTWTIVGDQAGTAFQRLADFPLPAERPAFVQGAVTQVPAKVFVFGDRLHLIVPAQLEHYVPERFMAACRDLGPGRRDVTDFIVERVTE